MNEDIQKKAAAHQGHRDRMKERFLREGLDGFEPHEILEIILYYALPFQDTNQLAHQILGHFGGSISRVLDAPAEELTRIPGVKKHTAVLIKLFPEVCRRYLMDSNKPGSIVKSSKEAAREILPLFIGKTFEAVVLMCLDAKGKVVYCDIVFEGSVNAAQVSVRRIVEICLRYASSDVIIGHNHPGGIAVPSEQDVIVTEKISAALKTVGVRLLDHLIVAGNDWVSLAATPTLTSLFSNGGGFRI